MKDHLTGLNKNRRPGATVPHKSVKKVSRLQTRTPGGRGLCLPIAGTSPPLRQGRFWVPAPAGKFHLKMPFLRLGCLRRRGGGCAIAPPPPPPGVESALPPLPACPEQPGGCASFLKKKPEGELSPGWRLPIAWPDGSGGGRGGDLQHHHAEALLPRLPGGPRRSLRGQLLHGHVVDPGGRGRGGGAMVLFRSTVPTPPSAAGKCYLAIQPAYARVPG